MGKVRAKLSKNLLLVFADSKKEHKTEFFHFNEAVFLTGLSEQRFKKLLLNGTLVFEFRMHLKERGQVRDHGSGFRINKKYVSSLYETSKILL